MKARNPALMENKLTAHEVTAQQVTAQQVTVAITAIDKPLNIATTTLSPLGHNAEGVAYTLTDIQAWQATAKPTAPDDSPPKRKRARKPRPNKGGWPTTHYISNNDVRSILDGLHQLERLKRRLTHFVTLKPPPCVEGDQPQKVWCRRQIDNIRRKLSRRRMKFVACYVYEKKDGGPIHVHLLVHIADHVSDLLSIIHNPPEIDVRPARPDHKAYITKNRKWQGPEREKWLRERIGLRWQKGAAFRGKRWDWSADAKKLLIRS
jgi:hypothetical protein